jgi:hypothetical protein
VRVGKTEGKNSLGMEMFQKEGLRRGRAEGRKNPREKVL